jgi:hypothetical protein
MSEQSFSPMSATPPSTINAFSKKEEATLTVKIVSNVAVLVEEASTNRRVRSTAITDKESAIVKGLKEQLIATTDFKQTMALTRSIVENISAEKIQAFYRMRASNRNTMLCASLSCKED